MFPQTSKKNSNKSDDTLTVFFDGSCPLCRSEIAFYQKKQSKGQLKFVDVSNAQTNFPAGLDQTTAMARFHVLSKDLGLLSGARAFSELWWRIPGWRAAGYLTSLPGAGFLFEGVYRFFLIFRPQIVKMFLKVKGSGESMK